MKCAISGFFDPITIGHVHLIRAAALFGNLIVIINNDKQAEAKKGYVFMPQDERAYIVANIAGVKDIFIAVDEDATVCESLKKVRPDVFCNGGDRTPGSTPEMEVCQKLGIMTVFGVGGQKTSSSSKLVEAVIEQWRP